MKIISENLFKNTFIFKVFALKFEYLMFVATVIITIISCFIVHNDQNTWKLVEPTWETQLPDKLRCHIDYIKPDENRYIMEGYSFIHGEDLIIVDYAAVLYDEITGEYYQIETDIHNVGDLSSFFDEGYKYDEGRFVAAIKKRYLTPGHSYTVNILYRNNNYNFLIPTNERIFVNEN